MIRIHRFRVKERQPHTDLEGNPTGYMESDRDWMETNRETALQMLENVKTINLMIEMADILCNIAETAKGNDQQTFSVTPDRIRRARQLSAAYQNKCEICSTSPRIEDFHMCKSCALIHKIAG